jgi:toxin ParE1/3/4
VQDAEAYQRLLDVAAGANPEEGIRQGLEDVKKKGRGPRGSSSTSSKPRMACLVKITSRAERDLAHLHRQIDAEYSPAALKWYMGLKEAILSLEEHPDRCPVTRKSDKLRHLLHGPKPHIYRVIYRVLEAETCRSAPHSSRRTSED